MSLTKYSFSGLIEKEGKIRIPKIQRDYAQGRKNKKVEEIRKTFVHTLLLVVKGKRVSTELDFVYGSNVRDAFEPLDGQQRLTTLFLLHWMMGVNLRTEEKTSHSLFTYETRNTSCEFCDELVQHEANIFIREARENKLSGDENKPAIISELISGRDWFKWEWKYDPTILSMLVMLDAIYEEMGDDWDTLDMVECRKNLGNITFNELNLGEFGLSDELFIKMNARGKQLSDFDKLKSTLEEELQIQQTEVNEQDVPLATEKDEEMWRTLMDGAWIDLFWQKYSSSVFANTENYTDKTQRNAERLAAAKCCELQFKKLLLRLIAIQILEADQSDWHMREIAYEMDERKIDNLLFEYSNSLTNLRSDEENKIVPNNIMTINYKRLMEDMNLFVYTDKDNKYHEMTDILSADTHINKDDNTIFDMFLSSKVENDVVAIFYSMLLFMRIFPVKKEIHNQSILAWSLNRDATKIWQDNFQDWVRMSRNVLLNVNNNQRIDKLPFLIEAMTSLRKFIDDFKKYLDKNNMDVSLNENAVVSFLASGSETYLRLDNQSLKEEREKAKLKETNSKWENEIDSAESDGYLWGQIRCLISWSGGDIEKFHDYAMRFSDMYSCMRGNLYYIAMLMISPNFWHDNGRLYQNNKERDNSFKRQLRDINDETGIYGQNIKTLIDCWNENYADLSAEDFLKTIIELFKSSAEVWIRCIAEYPMILDWAWNKRIFVERGHVILAQRKTSDSHCFDPVFLYLNYKCDDANTSDIAYEQYDSKATPAYGFYLKKSNDEYLIEWAGTVGNYVIKHNAEIDGNDCSAKDVIEYIENILTE